jgi:hypothetical protein
MTSGTGRLALWQRNLIGAAVAAVALGVIIPFDLWPKWATYRATVEPAHVIEPRQSLAVDGLTWAVADVKHLRREPRPGAPALPEGTVLMVVTVDRSGVVPPDTHVMGVLTDGERRWRGQSLGPAQGQLAWNFVIPGDAVPTALDITMLDGSIPIRLQL